jgi:methyl-accepting chemotaxis protein
MDLQHRGGRDQTGRRPRDGGGGIDVDNPTSDRKLVTTLIGKGVSAKLIRIGVAATLAIVALGAYSTLQARTLLFDARSELVQSQTETGLALLQAYGAREASGELTREEAQEAALDAVRELRYLGDEYFWINDHTPTMVMHPINPALDGENLQGFEDPDGFRLFVGFVETVEAEGEGFVPYLWPKPGSEQPQPKISYVAGYEPWGWILGTGLYVDDVQSTFLAQAVRQGGFATLVLLILGGLLAVTARSLTRPLRRQGDDLTAVTKEIGGVSSQLTVAADETASQANAVAAAGEQVSTNVEAVATAIEEMSASVREISENAGQATEVASAAVSRAEATNATIAQLGESSAEVGKVIEVITSIAEQTNLLALNATIEAARASPPSRTTRTVLCRRSPR